VTLSHTARDRAVFAHGALVAARWVVGRQGWFTMRDVLALDEASPGKKEQA
jgi:4-hydroxy-tetrahydrodipicolinate reductase